MAQQITSLNPDTLYANCVHWFIAKLDYTVPSLNRVQQLRNLPSGILIDIYEKMSDREDLKDMLLDHISNLETFARLLRISQARSQLLHIMAALMSSNKPLASNLQQSYVTRYQLPQGTANARTTPLRTATKLSTLAKARIQHALATAAAIKSMENQRCKNNNANDDTGTDTTTRDGATSTANENAATTAAAVIVAAITTGTIGTSHDDDGIKTVKGAADIAATIATTNSIITTNTATTTNDGDNNESGKYTLDLDIVNLHIQAKNDDGDAAAAVTIATIDYLDENESAAQIDSLIDPIDFGLRLGSFLSEAGWLSESIEVLRCVAARLKRMKPDPTTLIVLLDCLQRLLHSEAALCNFKSTERTFDEILELHKNIDPKHIPKTLLATTFTQLSAMYFARHEYDDSHMWGVLAMRHLGESTPERIVVDVLRQAAKACVVKRDFGRANMLICQATRRARKSFGPKHQKYGDALLDYGFFLLNVDSIYQSVNVYKEALEIKRSVFGNRNFHVAIAHEDLSYAYYVHEYSTGDFTCAQDHVDRAVDIMKDLVPGDHLMLASAKRVKALLLEEIALDKMQDGIDEDGLLNQSEELHKFALQLSLQVFGEVNVQTAKHYGNLGRLYQTMNRFEEAERMHQKAIKIKTDLLGPFDYEVGLSIGHLASLYNYQMRKYREAENLYLRSIDISLRLFGRSYSGLEYDYLGLCHVYETLHEFEKYLRYATILENWQLLRGQNISMNKSIYPAINDECSLEEVKHKFFFNMCSKNDNESN